METVINRKKTIKSWCILAALLMFFLGMLAACGVGVYNDSEQYITMHIHREPLYPLFLAFFRKICGDAYLTVAAVAQNVLTAVGIWIFTEYVAAHFRLWLWEELLVVLLQLVPHLMTRYVSALHIFLENSVMSEALCIPLFHFFMYYLLRMVFEQHRRDRIISLVFAFLLSMTRGQMMITILIWMVVLLLQMLFYKKYQTLFIPIIAAIAVFGLRSLTVHVYNYGVTGYFMGNTYAQVNTLTNVIYACDREDGEVFEDGSLEREFFERFYDEADAIEANYRYGGSTFAQRAAHLESHHDELKFQVLEADMSAYFFGLGKVDYYQQSSMSDELAGRMLAKLLPACFGQWLYDYISLCVYGFIRSVAVVHLVLNWLALALYAVAIGLAVRQVFRGRRRKNMDVMLREGGQDAAWVMGVALLFIAANVCATSITIMCLSRYMIYGFSLFYTALFLLVREVTLKK
ncbi:MAG: hypothetical protein HDR04_01235 [Lachnospiraceae bacterium]|nr:hypothetical protein [Lachnospiraceae bacterium]